MQTNELKRPRKEEGTDPFSKKRRLPWKLGEIFMSAWIQWIQKSRRTLRDMESKLKDKTQQLEETYTKYETLTKQYKDLQYMHEITNKDFESCCSRSTAFETNIISPVMKLLTTLRHVSPF